jgi:hypothetical protein
VYNYVSFLAGTGDLSFVSLVHKYVPYSGSKLYYRGRGSTIDILLRSGIVSKLIVPNVGRLEVGHS